jgi:amidophosphoribosyltransferase
MCGITALLIQSIYECNEEKNIASLLKKSIQRIQHRGYDGAGIALPSTKQIIIKKGKGLIKDVLNPVLIDELKNFPVQYGIAHTRYKTKGECTSGASQPLLSDDGRLCLVHNGQVETTKYTPDSMYILELIKNKLATSVIPEPEQILEAIKHVFKTLKGAYSCILMIQDFGLVVFRDPHGIRPLIFATNQNGDFGVASEDIALKSLSLFNSLESQTTYSNLLAGECLIVRPGKPTIKENLLDINAFNTPCIFEYIYLAHPDSNLNGISVHEARELLGELLADQMTSIEKHIDYIIPIPETSCIATKTLSDKMCIPYLRLLKLNKNREKARTFILPTQEERIKAVTSKFVIDDNFKDTIRGKTILLVDDSIIRGTTLGYVVKYIKENCHPAKIILSSISPPVRFKNIYGIDVPNTEHLIASKYDSHEEIAEALNADQIIYQDYAIMMRRFQEVGMKLDPPISNFESSLFSGTYIY